MINKNLFGLKPYQILEKIRNEVEKLPVSEDLKELEIEVVRKILANGPFLKEGVGFSAYPLSFFEELFWVALLKGEKTFLVEVDWSEEGKPFWWIKKEGKNFEEEPIPLKELFEKLEIKNKPERIVAIDFLNLRDLKEPIFVDWDEEELSLVEYLIESGTYLFKTSPEGITFKKLG